MTTSCFIELRKSSARGTDSVIADVMRHLHTRQHLGRAVVVCDQPTSTLSAGRKQWLRLSRSLQKQRASTLNADKILKYTHTITRMQHMRFLAKAPLDQPIGDVYFLQPHELTIMPVHCWSVYVMCDLSRDTALKLLYQLPTDALIVDYLQSPQWLELGLSPKRMLEERVASQWRQADNFLSSYQIDIKRLVLDDIHSVEAMDDALDTLLGGHAHQFLQVASEFQRSLELARPLRLSKNVRELYDMLVLMAHRVQALTPGAFAYHFLEVYDENDTFFLYDPRRAQSRSGTETLAQAFARHEAAGRHNLAQSLKYLAQNDGHIQKAYR